MSLLELNALALLGIDLLLHLPTSGTLGPTLGRVFNRLFYDVPFLSLDPNSEHRCLGAGLCQLLVILIRQEYLIDLVLMEVLGVVLFVTLDIGLRTSLGQLRSGCLILVRLLLRHRSGCLSHYIKTF